MAGVPPDALRKNGQLKQPPDGMLCSFLPPSLAHLFRVVAHLLRVVAHHNVLVALQNVTLIHLS